MVDTFEKHSELVNSVLKTLAEAGIKVNLDKSEMFQYEVEYLGHIIGTTGMRKSVKYVEAIVNFPKPSTVREMKQFLGLVNFQRKFIPHCSVVQKALSETTGGKGNQKIQWTREMETSFEQLKQLVSCECLLTFPNYSDPDNKLAVICGYFKCWSRSLLNAEARPTNETHSLCISSIF